MTGNTGDDEADRTSAEEHQPVNSRRSRAFRETAVLGADNGVGPPHRPREVLRALRSRSVRAYAGCAGC